mgnify:CR=1 FL=1
MSGPVESVIEVDGVGQGALSLELTGPGIDGRRALRLTGLHPDWLTRRADWVGGFLHRLRLRVPPRKEIGHAERAESPPLREADAAANRWVIFRFVRRARIQPDHHEIFVGVRQVVSAASE